jgi:hypothetical protein
LQRKRVYKEVDIVRMLRAKAVRGKSATDVPEFAALAQAAKVRGMRWGKRVELYRKLGIPNRQKIAVEMKVVEHFLAGGSTPEWVSKLVRNNLFCLGDNGSGRSIFEDELRAACEEERSGRAAALRLGMPPTRVYQMLRELPPESKTDRRDRLSGNGAVRGYEIVPDEQLIRETVAGILF